MEKRRSIKKAYFRYAALALLVIFFVAAGLLFLRLWERGQGTYTGKDDIATDRSYLEYEGKRYTQRKNVDTFLVLGLDAFETDENEDSYNNNKRADFLALFMIDHAEETVTVLQINRDTIAEMNILGVAGQSVGKVTKQIALAHTYGNGREVSCRNTADAVSDLLYGTKIDHYMSVTMDAVPFYTDLLGGIEVTVLDDFSGIDDTLKKGETVMLNGEQALTYVRSRQGMEDSSNQNRMARQEQVISAFYDASMLRMKEDSAFAVDAVLTVSDYMISDRTVTQLQELVNTLAAYRFEAFVTLEGETHVGDEFMEFVPDEDALKQLVITLLYEEVSGS